MKNINTVYKVNQNTMVVTTRRTTQENTVRSPTDNDDVDHSSLDTSVSPTVPEDTPADNEVFHDTKHSIDEENDDKLKK